MSPMHLKRPRRISELFHHSIETKAPNGNYVLREENEQTIKSANAQASLYDANCRQSLMTRRAPINAKI